MTGRILEVLLCPIRCPKWFPPHHGKQCFACLMTRFPETGHTDFYPSSNYRISIYLPVRCHLVEPAPFEICHLWNGLVMLCDNIARSPHFYFCIFNNPISSHLTLPKYFITLCFVLWDEMEPIANVLLELNYFKQEVESVLKW